MHNIASKILDRFWDGSLPIDPRMIAQNMNISVQPDYFMQDESGRIEKKDGRITIFYNPYEPPIRQRFTIAHEIAHFALGHLTSAQTQFRDNGRNFFITNRDPKEVAANKLAAEILMPEKSIHFVIEQKNAKSVDDLANLFFVSKTAMDFRIKNLNLGVLIQDE